MSVATREVLINGRWSLLLPHHRADRGELWNWWEATRLAAMASVIGPGSVVWDVGAEEGDFPALWASWGADVVLAEPNERVWPNIRLVFEANGLPDPLLCWPGFIGDSEHLADVAVPDGWPACADGPVIGDHGFCQLGERPDIPVTSIDMLVASCAVPPPTVLTMDVEGSELHVLRGAAVTLRDHRPTVFVSIHEAFMLHHYGIVDGVGEVNRFMAGFGYTAIYLCSDHEAHWYFKP